MLKQIIDSGKVAIDDDWRLIREYRANLNESGEPGPGDLFLKWLLTNRTNTRKCETVRITPFGGNDNYKEFPTTLDLQGFDPSDRKFVAVAVAVGSNAVVLQAVDRKWWVLRHALQKARILVDFICKEEVEL